MIFSCDRYPKEIEGLEDRLKSRFGWGLSVVIDPPALETRTAILLKKAEEMSLELPEECAFFIAQQVKSNVRELEGALKRVATLFKAPSSSLTFDLTCCAIKKAHSSGSSKLISSAFFKRMAVLVSRAGGSITTDKPQPNLDLSLSSSPSISLGYLSQENIIIFPLSIRLLNV